MVTNDDYCVHFNHKGLLRTETSASQQQQETQRPQREAEREVEVGFNTHTPDDGRMQQKHVVRKKSDYRISYI